jgi:MFS superfamily sulfate permease-like transporter
MLFLAPAMGALPYATLAAVVVAYSIGLIDPQELMAIRRVRTREFRWALAALAGVVVLGTLKGILVAVILSLLSLLQQANNPPVYAVRRRPGTDEFEPITDRSGTDSGLPGLLILRAEGLAYFANTQVISEKLRALIDTAQPRVVIMDCRAIIDFEYTALKALIEGEAEFRGKGIELWFAALNPEPLAQVRRTPLAATLGERRLFASLHTAVAAYETTQLTAASTN